VVMTSKSVGAWPPFARPVRRFDALQTKELRPRCGADAGRDAATNLQLRWRCATMRRRLLRHGRGGPERLAEPVEPRCGLTPPLWQVPYSAWTEPERPYRRCRLSPCCAGGCPLPERRAPRYRPCAMCAV